MSLSSFHLPRSVLEIDLSLIKRNCLLLKNFCREQFFCPIVKDNAYGHGAVSITKILKEIGIKQVGVINATEAWQIREFVTDPPDILIFGPILNEEDWKWISREQKCIPVINNLLDLEQAKNLKIPLRIHLKFDTGFTRLGFAPKEAEKVKSFLKATPLLQVEGICTQLLNGKEAVETESLKQIKTLNELKLLFSAPLTHSLNTEALICQALHQGKASDGARPGIGLYGIKPAIPFQQEKIQEKWNHLSFKSTSILKSYIVNIHHLKKGGKVSYSGTWQAKKDSIIATVSLGYGDGFSRSFSNKGRVLYRGKRCPLVGRVCMDFFMIDVTGFSEPPPHIGEEVVIFGNQQGSFLSVTEQANCIDTIPYEIFTSLGERVNRTYTNLV